MKAPHRNILLTVVTLGLLGSLAALPFSPNVAFAILIGNLLMAANMWVLMKTLSSLFGNETPDIARSLVLLLLKTVGLFGICYLFVGAGKIGTLPFGLSAAATTLAFSLGLTILNQNTEASA